jgi:excisionase family DNA binding protein
LTRRRLTVAEAADTLGISQDAVRMRVKRGTLEAERDGRQVFVLLDTAGSGVGSQPDTSALISEMRGRIEDLRTQLEAERQGHAEARRLLAAALERIPPQLEAPPTPTETPPDTREYAVTPTPQPGRVEPQAPLEGAQEPSESPVTAADEQQGRGPVPDAGGPREGGTERSWWRRMFGG